ncbi:MAG: hypothetical protein WDN24_17835 [Sphingomonas sp.]
MSTRDELGQTLCAEVARMLDVSTVLLLPSDGQLVLRAAFPPEDSWRRSSRRRRAGVYDHNQPAGRGSDSLTASEWRFQPLAAGGHVLGVLGLARRDAGQPIRSDQLPCC